MAVISPTGSLTYLELYRGARNLAHHFTAEGFKPGTRVAVLYHNSIEAAQLLLACLMSGLVAVPISGRFKVPEVARLLRESGSPYCFAQQELVKLAEAARARCWTLPTIVRGLPPCADVRAPLPQFEDSAPAVILYTAGTATTPKGAIHNHGSLHKAAECLGALGLDENQVVLIMTPLMHASGLTCQLIPALIAGATAVLEPVFDPPAILDSIERNRCTFTIALPAMFRQLVQAQVEKPRDVSSLTRPTAGGDAVPASLQHAFQDAFGQPLYEAHGMAECMPTCANRPGAVKTGSIGKPAPGVEIRIVDIFGYNNTPGTTGQILVRAGHCFSGYHNDVAATAAALRNGWLYTGDLGWQDKDGYLWFAHRASENIIRGGTNVSPEDVEEVLISHHAVAEAAVVGVHQPLVGESIIGFVVLKEGERTTDKILLEYARERLPHFKMPESIRFLNSIPRSATGKVLRRVLRDTVELEWL